MKNKLAAVSLNPIFPHAACLETTTLFTLHGSHSFQGDEKLNLK